MGTAARIDRHHVTLGTETERLYWEVKLGAHRADLAEAVAEVGDEPAAVTAWLARNRRRGLQPGEQKSPE